LTSAFTKSDPLCPTLIRNSWQAINALGKSQQGLANMTSIFKLCSSLKNSDLLKNWLSDIYGKKFSF
jgi:hypothetical protein